MFDSSDYTEGSVPKNHRLFIKKHLLTEFVVSSSPSIVEGLLLIYYTPLRIEWV